MVGSADSGSTERAGTGSATAGTDDGGTGSTGQDERPTYFDRTDC